MNTFLSSLVVAGIGAALSASVTTSIAAEESVTCTGLRHADNRVLERSYQGVDALRRYVLITRPVHQISMVDVVELLDKWRAKAQCTTQTAGDAGTPAATTAVAQAKR
jgi:hypothetical protein